MTTMKRQGDVLLISVEEIPKGLKPVPLDNGRVILAYGEATGHAHAVLGDAELLASDIAEMEDRFLKVDGEMKVDVPVYDMRPTGRMITPEPYYDAELGATVTPDPYPETEQVQVGRRSETVGAQVVHEEHGTVPLEAGLWKVRRQREYAPEEIRFVAD